MHFQEDLDTINPADPAAQIPSQSRPERTEAEMDHTLAAGITEVTTLALRATPPAEGKEHFFRRNLESEAELRARDTASKVDYLEHLDRLRTIVENPPKHIENETEFRSFLESQGVHFVAETDEHVLTARNVTFSEAEIAAVFGHPAETVMELREEGKTEEQIRAQQQPKLRKATAAIVDLQEFINGRVVTDQWGPYHGLRRVWREVTQEANPQLFNQTYEEGSQLRTNFLTLVPIAHATLSPLTHDQIFEAELMLREGDLLSLYYGTEPNTKRYADMTDAEKLVVVDKYKQTAALTLQQIKLEAKIRLDEDAADKLGQPQ